MQATEATVPPRLLDSLSQPRLPGTSDILRKGSNRLCYLQSQQGSAFRNLGTRRVSCNSLRYVCHVRPPPLHSDLLLRGLISQPLKITLPLPLGKCQVSPRHLRSKQ